ncbi:hypothetical protein [Gloeomargarita sp.]
MSAEMIALFSTFLYLVPLNLFSVVFFLFFCSAPLLAILSAVRSLGTFEIACTKLEPQTVDCELVHKPYFPLFPTTKEIYSGIKGAQYDLETRREKDSEGDEITYTVHYVIFQKVTGQEKVEFEGDVAQFLVNHIQDFLKDNRPNSSAMIAREADLTFWLIIGPLLGFLAIGSLVATTVIYREWVEINPYCVIHTRIGLPWYKKVIRFTEIDCLKVTEEIAEESTRKIYTLKLVIQPRDGFRKSGQEIRLYAHNAPQEVLQLSQELADRMGVPQVLPKHLCSSS